jgi:hypothetical protein
MGNVVRDGRAWADIGLRVSLSAALLFALSVFSGCTLAEIRSQSSIIENLGIIQGSVKRASGQDGPIVVLRFKEGDGMFLLDGRTQAKRRIITAAQRASPSGPARPSPWRS